MAILDAIDRSAHALRDAFRQDLGGIANALIEAFGLRFEKAIPSLSDPLQRWFDFAFRYVEPMPRQVLFSDQFSKQLHPTARRGLDHFVRRLLTGQDVNPYQGRGLKLRHDTSGSSHSNRTDYLFASWGILHFHLSDKPIPTDQYFSKPSDWLAFCVVTNDQVALINVARHPDKQGFSDPHLFETLARNWPDYVERYRMKGVLAGKPLSQAEIHRLRELGGNAAYVYNGNAYMGPGGGYTSAGTSMTTAMVMIKLTRTIDWLAEMVWLPSGPYVSHEQVANINEPRFALRLYDGGLGIYEETSRVFFAHPRQNPLVEGSVRWLSDLLIPSWALPEVIKHKHRFDSLFCEKPSETTP
jgi:hypothetical protein